MTLLASVMVESHESKSINQVQIGGCKPFYIQLLPTHENGDPGF